MKTLSEEVCSVCGSSALPGDHLCPVHMKELCKKFEDALKKQEQDEADRALGATVRAEIKELRENEHRNVTESQTLVILLDLEKKAGLMK